MREFSRISEYADRKKELVQISRYAGMREDLVQAGGGNTSVKLDDTRMLIKASGVQLADVTEDTGYSVLDYAMVTDYMEAMQRGEKVCTAEELLKNALIEGGRPSIETFLHAVTGRVTLHVHSTAVNVLTARKGGMDVLSRLFPDALLVGYGTPGVALADVYYQAYRESTNIFVSGSGRETSRSMPVIFLKNHGLVVSGDTAAEVIELTETVCKKSEEYTGLDFEPYRRGYEIYRAFEGSGMNDGNLIVKAENKTVLDAYRDAGNSLWEYRICPDCVVFCGRQPFQYEEKNLEEKLRSHIERYGMPVLIQDGKNLFIRAESVRKAREIESVLTFSAQAAAGNQGFEMDVLTEQEQAFLLGWDAEKYRREMRQG